jgi:hypothetical protein
MGNNSHSNILHRCVCGRIYQAITRTVKCRCGGHPMAIHKGDKTPQGEAALMVPCTRSEGCESPAPSERRE